MAEEGIDNIQKRFKKANKKVDKTNIKVTTQTQRIKDLTRKLRSSDKLCCDIILIFIYDFFMIVWIIFYPLVLTGTLG